MAIEDNRVPEIRKFKCKFCDLRFISGQALGGHQKSHRAQRQALKLTTSQPRPSEFYLSGHPPTMPPHFPPVPMSPLLSMQLPSLLHSFNPHRLQPALTFTEPRCTVDVCQPWCSGHGVGSNGAGGLDDTATRLRLDEMDPMRRPYEVNFEALVRGFRYYEEWKNKDGDKLDLTLHL